MKAPGSASFAWTNTLVVIPDEIRAARALWHAALAAEKPVRAAYGTAFAAAVDANMASRSFQPETPEQAAEIRKAISRQLERDISRTYGSGRSDKTRRVMITKLSTPALGAAWAAVSAAADAIGRAHDAYRHLFHGEGDRGIDGNEGIRQDFEALINHILRSEEAGECPPETLPPPEIITIHVAPSAPSNERNNHPAKSRCRQCGYAWTRPDVPFCTLKHAAQYCADALAALGPTTLAMRQPAEIPGTKGWRVEVVNLYHQLEAEFPDGITVPTA